MNKMLHKLAALNWTGAVLLPLSVILTEIFLFYPWLMLIGKWPGFVQGGVSLSLGSVLILLISSFLVTAYLRGRAWHLRWLRLCMITSGLAGVLLVLRAEYPAADGGGGLWLIGAGELIVGSFTSPHPIIIAVFSALYLWWRGIRLASAVLTFEYIYRLFAIGIFVQAILIVSWGASSLDGVMAGPGLFVAGFFLAGLAALAIARLQGVQRRGLEADTNAILRGRWLATITVVISVIVMLGIGIASIFTIGFLAGLGKVFAVVAGALFWVLNVIITVAGFIMAAVFYIVQLILNALQGEVPEPEVIGGNMTTIAGIQQEIMEAVPAGAMLALKWGILILIFAIIIFFILKSMSKRKGKPLSQDIDEVHESLWSWSNFLDDIKLFLMMILNGIRGKARQGAAGIFAVRGRRIRGLKDGVNVREAYRNMLIIAGDLGIIKHKQETPFEFSRRLAQASDSAGPPLRELTDLYVGVRYGETADESRQTAQANSLWRRLRELLLSDLTQKR